VLITHQIVSAGKLLDINVLDHLVIGQGRYCSMREIGVASQVSIGKHHIRIVDSNTVSSACPKLTAVVHPRSSPFIVVCYTIGYMAQKEATGSFSPIAS
jgi:hypothetical protein